MRSAADYNCTPKNPYSFFKTYFHSFIFNLTVNINVEDKKQNLQIKSLFLIQLNPS